MTEHVKSKDRDPDKDKNKDNGAVALDRALMDTFPASDPLASTQPRSSVGAPDDKNRERGVEKRKAS